MKYLQCLFQTCVTTLVITGLEAVRDYTIEVVDGNITVFDYTYSKSLNYRIYNKKKIYIDFVLKKNITEFDLKIKADLIKKDNRRINLLKFTLNGCEALVGAQKALLLQLIYREMFRVTNVPKKCPLLADKLYFFKNYTIKDDDYPVIIPLVEWKLSADFLVGKELKATFLANGRVRKL